MIAPVRQAGSVFDTPELPERNSLQFVYKEYHIIATGVHQRRGEVP